MNFFAAIQQIIPDTVLETMKATPPAAVVVIDMATQEAHAGARLQNWVYIATLVYIGLQAGWLLWKWYRAAKAKDWTPGDE